MNTRTALRTRTAAAASVLALSAITLLTGCGGGEAAEGTNGTYYRQFTNELQAVQIEGNDVTFTKSTCLDGKVDEYKGELADGAATMVIHEHYPNGRPWKSDTHTVSINDYQLEVAGREYHRAGTPVGDEIKNDFDSECVEYRAREDARSTSNGN